MGAREKWGRSKRALRATCRWSWRGDGRSEESWRSGEVWMGQRGWEGSRRDEKARQCANFGSAWVERRVHVWPVSGGANRGPGGEGCRDRTDRGYL